MPEVRSYHEEISWIQERRHGVADVREVRKRVARLAEENRSPSLAKEKGVGEHLVQGVRRLVEHHDHVNPLGGEGFQSKHKVKGSRRVESRSRFVLKTAYAPSDSREKKSLANAQDDKTANQNEMKKRKKTLRSYQKEDGRVGDHLHANVHALALSPRYAALRLIANLRVAHMLELQGLNNVLHHALDLVVRKGPRQAHLRVRLENLADRELAVHGVLLRHKTDESAQACHVVLLAVDEKAPRLRPVVGAAAERVEEGGFACSRWSLLTANRRNVY